MQATINDNNGDLISNETNLASATIINDNGGGKIHKFSSTIIPLTNTAMTNDSIKLQRHCVDADNQARSMETSQYCDDVSLICDGNLEQPIIDIVECLGSNVEQISGTPSTSPEASPSKEYYTALHTPLVTSTSGDILTSMLMDSVNLTLNNTNTIRESSGSSVKSICITPSLNKTPILHHNGNGCLQSKSKLDNNDYGGGDFLEIHNICLSMDRKEKILTLPIKTETCEIITKASSSSSSSSSPSLSSSIPSSTTSQAKSISTTTLATTTTNTPITDPALLHWKDMPEYLQFNPYVLKGYRPLQTFKGCLLSLFYWHNETINILTHAIPIVYILAIVPGLMPWEKEFRFLSFCHLFGSVAPWCGSFVYHLFMNIEKGENVYYRLLKLDMVGIWVSQSFGALPLVTASTFCFSFKWKWFIIISYCLMSLWGLYKALTACSPWQRRLCFALPFSMRSVLTLLRTMGWIGGSRVALSHVYLQDGVSVLGGAIGAMRIPEKWLPGLVDFYLNSHNIMHVLVVVAVYSMHKATMKDFEWMSTTNCDAFKNSTTQAIGASLIAKIEL